MVVFNNGVVWAEKIYNRVSPTKSTPLWSPASLLAHRLVSTPFEEQRQGWHTVWITVLFGLKGFIIELPLPNALPLGSNVLTSTPPRVYPLRGRATRLAHRPDNGVVWTKKIHIRASPTKSTPLWCPAFLLTHCLVSTPFEEQRQG